jgi:hypothetical protein
MKLERKIYTKRKSHLRVIYWVYYFNNIILGFTGRRCQIGAMSLESNEEAKNHLKNGMMTALSACNTTTNPCQLGGECEEEKENVGNGQFKCHCKNGKIKML